MSGHDQPVEAVSRRGDVWLVWKTGHSAFAASPVRQAATRIIDLNQSFMERF
jgi:hypothetical protein